MADTCWIWETPAEIVREGRSGEVRITSVRAGGQYQLTNARRILVENLQPEVKARLTTWLVDQRRQGNEWPEISREAIELAREARNLRVSEKMERFFLAVDAAGLQVEEPITLAGPSSENKDRWKAYLGAWTEAIGQAGGLDILQLLIDRGFLAPIRTHIFRVTADGWAKVEELTAGRTHLDQGFVAMWFDPSMGTAYEEGILPAIRDAGYREMRIDRKEHSNKIDDEIIAEIRRSRFVVADMTCATKRTDDGDEVSIPRGGVYFEAGFALGLGIPVIWTARADCLSAVHFDTRQFNHITWETPAELRERLKVRIGAVLGYGPHAPASA